jgi:hypothetical protein
MVAPHIPIVWFCCTFYIVVTMQREEDYGAQNAGPKICLEVIPSWIKIA